LAEELSLGRFALFLISVVGPALAAEDPAVHAREELEREMREMVQLPAASVEVVFDGIDSTRYKLLEASFALDDRSLAVAAGAKILYAGELPPGKHTLTANFLYETPAPSSGSVKYRVPGKFIFTAQRGIFMRVRAHIEVDDGAEPSKRLQLVGNAEADLRAKLEDGLLPPPRRPEPPLEDKGAIRYGKRPAEEPETDDEMLPIMRWRERRRDSGAKLAAQLRRIAETHPIAKTHPIAETRPAAETARARDESDLQVSAAPLAAATPAPQSAPSAASTSSRPAFGAAGAGVAGSAFALIALLVSLIVWRRR
jgi:hypothetical protein